MLKKPWSFYTPFKLTDEGYAERIKTRRYWEAWSLYSDADDEPDYQRVYNFDNILNLDSDFESETCTAMKKIYDTGY